MCIEERLGSITGQITIDGKPAAGLEAALMPHHYYVRENAIATVKTDSDGRYRFTEVPSGRYWISMQAPGYVNAVNWDEEGPGRNVSEADAQSVENADLDLTLGGVVAGRITDTEGMPVVGEYVELTFADEGPLHDVRLDFYSEGDEFSVTDIDGRYRIYGIPAGRYLVSVGVDVAKLTGATRGKVGFLYPTGQVDGDHYFEQTFHPGVRDRTRAKVIDISAGAEARDVNISVGRSFRAYTVSGRVIDVESGEPIRKCYIQLGQRIGSGFWQGGRTDTDDANFSVKGLLPGRFFVSAQFDGETEVYCTPVEFEVRDRDINGLEIKAHRGLTLSGSVIVEGGKEEEVTTRLAQLKVHTTSDRQDIGHDCREATVNSDGSFTIRGLRPGSVRIDLGYEEASRYFSIIRIEYPDDAGETLSILPASMTLTPKLSSFCTPTIPKDVSPLQKAPTVSPELHPLPPAPPNQFPSQRNIVSISLSSDYPASYPSPSPIAHPQNVPVALPSELLDPRFPGDLPPLPLSEHGLSGVRLVLSYKNGRIRGRVSFTHDKLDPDPRLQAGISRQYERGGCWSTSRDVDPNGNFSIEGLDPAEYEVSVCYDFRNYSETKTVIVNKDCETLVSFVIDLAQTKTETE